MNRQQRDRLRDVIALGISVALIAISLAEGLALGTILAVAGLTGYAVSRYGK